MKFQASLLLAGSVLVTGCGIIGGGNKEPVMAPVPLAPSAPTAPGSAPPRPGAVAPMSPADYRGPAPGSVTAAPAPAGNTLYTRLGGVDAIRSVVHAFLGRVAADDRINSFFRGVDLVQLERLLTEQICQASGGPCSYTGRTMRATHEGMNLTDAHFNALVEDLGASLDQFNVRPAEKAELLTSLATMRGDIVGH